MTRIKFYIRLNRTLGATEQRVDEKAPYEIIFPVWNPKSRTFSAPAFISTYWASSAFKTYLQRGEAVLVNHKGGWNTLSKSDRILEFYTA